MSTIDRYTRRDALVDVGRKTTGASLLALSLLHLTTRSAVAAPLKEQRIPTVEYFDGTDKTLDPAGGHKLILVSGILTPYQGNNTFSHLLSTLRPIGITEADCLPLAHAEGSNDWGMRLHAVADTLKHPTENKVLAREAVRRFRNIFGPNYRYIVVGYSQGGDIALDLTEYHADVVDACITFSGAQKGANFIPSQLDTVGAHLIAGEAGKYYFDKASDTAYGEQIEGRIGALKAKRVNVFTFGSVRDVIIPSHLSVARNSDTSVGGRELTMVDDMDVWEDLVSSPEFTARVEAEFSKSGSVFSLDRLWDLLWKQRQAHQYTTDWYGHAGPLRYRPNLEQAKSIVAYFWFQHRRVVAPTPSPVAPTAGLAPEGSNLRFLQELARLQQEMTGGR